NGFKIKLAEGCSAFEEETRAVERAANLASGDPVPAGAAVPRQDLLSPYLEALKLQVNWPLLSKSRLRLVADSMHGSAGTILVGRGKPGGEVVRTFSGTQMVDRLSQAHGLRLHETPIGFKHIARLMLDREVLVGGEESNGFGFGGHIPERDGLLGALVIAEML